jgi:RES domain-containing protein
MRACLPEVLWRISNHADLLGIGGTYASARWHTAGQPIVYLAENPSSALLEVLIHLEIDEDHRPDSYQLLKVQVGISLPHEEIFSSSLSEGWKDSELETRSVGDEWLRRAKTAILRVPSAIVPETWNWILNPRHPQAGDLKITKVEKHLYDPRLFK